MARFRAIHVVVAGALTAVLGTLGYAAVLIGRGRYLEDLCTTREPAGAWAPREYAVRGPLPDGLLDFRCEAVGAPQYRFSFTDPMPLLGTCAVAALITAVALLLWAWALRAPAARPGAGHGSARCVTRACSRSR